LPLSLGANPAGLALLVATSQQSGVPPRLPSFQQTLLSQITAPHAQASVGTGNSNLLDAAAAALLRQQLTQQRERAQLQHISGSLLRNRLVTGSGNRVPKTTLSLHPAIRSPILRHGVPSTYGPPPSRQQPQDTQAVVSKKPDNANKALEVLGSSLRKASDPYIDVSFVKDPDPETSQLRRTRGGVTEPFPEKLHRMLNETEQEGHENVVSFFSHGRAFAVHDMDKFVKDIMPRYFKQTKWNSFARQLNLYGFKRISSGPDAGGYYHELFLKGRSKLCFHMRRVGVPQGTTDRRKFKSNNNNNVEPDFYSMKKITSTTKVS
jgi:hypothetical protein